MTRRRAIPKASLIIAPRSIFTETQPPPSPSPLLVINDDWAETRGGRWGRVGASFQEERPYLSSDSQVDLDHQNGQEPQEVTSVLGGKLDSKRA